MKLKQIQQFNADKFEGDIFSYIKNIPEQKLQVIAVAVFKSNDDEEIQSVFRGIEKILEVLHLKEILNNSLLFCLFYI